MRKKSILKMDCPVCFEPIIELIYPSCSHKVCYSCYQTIHNGSIKRCPLCRELYEESPDIPVENHFKDKILCAEGGCSSSMLWIGRAYEIGYEVTKNKTSALIWYKKAAEAGDMYAATDLGEAYLDGLINEVDRFAKAIFWTQKAVGAGISKAMFNMGKMYTQGKGFKQNYELAIKWFERSLSSGYIHFHMVTISTKRTNIINIKLNTSRCFVNIFG